MYVFRNSVYSVRLDQPEAILHLADAIAGLVIYMHLRMWLGGASKMNALNIVMSI